MAELNTKIQEVFNEPGCDKNQGKGEKERKKGCTKQLTPGAAAGGCAFDGAKIALQPITDVAHVVHGPIACEGNSWDNRGARSSGSQLYRRGFTTDIMHNDVVFGGEQKLYDAIIDLGTRYSPKAIFAHATGVRGMIGDDLEAVCPAAAKHVAMPVIPVNPPGFIGDKNIGNRLAGEVLLKHVIGTAEPPPAGPASAITAARLGYCSAQRRS